jgi:hypothetical protein
MFFIINYFHKPYLLKKVVIFSMIIIPVYFIGTVVDSEYVAIEGSTLILSNNTFDSINPQFSVSRNRIHASWISDVNSQNSEVMFKKLDKDSESFTNPMNISDSFGISNIIKLTNSENNVYITWENKQAGLWELLFRKSQDNGEKFGKVINLSKTTGNVHLHDLLAAGKNVFAAWAANENISSTNKDVFFRKSLDHGESFSDTINLSNSNDDSLDPHMAINHNGSVIYIVWTECDIKRDEPICNIVFAKSTDEGNTFTIPKNISNTIQPYDRTINQTAFDSTFGNGSSIVREPPLLNNTTIQEGINSINPTVFATLDAKNVFVLWEQDKFGTGRSEIFLKISNDYGKSFNSEINVSNTAGVSRLAQAQVVGEDLYVVWSDTLDHYNSFDVMLRKIDLSNKAGKIINLSNNTGNSVSPSVLVSNNRIYVAWSDDTNNPSILLRTGDTSGLFAIAKKLNNYNAASYTDPSIFEARDKVWIAWTEYNNSEHRIVLVDQEIYDIPHSQ